MSFLLRMTTPEGDTHYAAGLSHHGRRCCSFTVAGAELFPDREAAEKAAAEIRALPHVRPYFYEVLPHEPAPEPPPLYYRYEPA